MSEQSPAVDTVADDDQQDLRLALVMSGGVSLAVWMGGVAHEFHRVTRADGPVYSELLRLTATKARVDVISGTSAGGLNGSLLAMAVVRDSTIGRLRDLWLRLGSLQTLLRPPGEVDPPSLMRGDDYFLPQIAHALRDLQSGTTRPGDAPMDLRITTTLLRAQPRGVADDFGTIIQDADHRGEFVFRRGLLVSSLDLRTDERDDFAHPEIVEQLALASRSTASFPFAFEASFCPANQSTAAEEGRPDLGGVASFETSRYVVDGGVLVNRPLRPALQAIFAQPAGPQVRRVLAYVVPDPGQAKDENADVQAKVPSLAEIALASLVRIPRNQSIGNELDDLRTHNARVDGQRRRRELAVGALDLDAFAVAAYEQYREMRAERLADWLFDLLARWLTALETRDPQAVGDVPLWQRARLKSHLLPYLRTLPPGEFPVPGEPVAAWFTTSDTVERAGMVVLDLLRRGLGVTDPIDDRTLTVRRTMQRLRAQVHAWMRLARGYRRTPTDEEQRAHARTALKALGEEDPGSALGEWAAAVVPELLGEPDSLQPIVQCIAQQLEPAVAAVLEACEAAPNQLRPQAEQTGAYAAGLGAGLDDGPLSPEQAALRRLLALEVVERSLGDEPDVEQRVEVIQVSADAQNGFDATREKPEDKLAGLQLGHFGAFYKRSWRANDWMWGRLDGAQRLAQVLLEPARLRQLGYSAENARAAIEKAALGALGSEERRVLDRKDWPNRWSRDAALEELAFLDDPKSALPNSLPICSQALARRVQLQILREELGAVAAAIRSDRDAHAYIPPEAASFEKAVLAAESASARAAVPAAEPVSGEAAVPAAEPVSGEAAVPAAEPVSAEAAVTLFQSCTVGQERLRAEQGSDLLAQTTSQSLAVGTAALSGSHAGIPARAQGLLRSLRGAALVFHLFVSYALSGTRAAGSIAAAMLTTGAVLTAVGLVVRVPGILLVAGVGLVLAGIVLAAYRHGWAVPLRSVLVAAIIACSPRVTIWVWDAIDDGKVVPGWVAFLERIEPVVVVLGLLVGAHVLGRSAIRWPKPEANPDPRAAAAPKRSHP